MNIIRNSEPLYGMDLYEVQCFAGTCISRMLMLHKVSGSFQS